MHARVREKLTALRRKGKKENPCMHAAYPKKGSLSSWQSCQTIVLPLKAYVSVGPGLSKYNTYAYQTYT